MWLTVIGAVVITAIVVGLVYKDDYDFQQAPEGVWSVHYVSKQDYGINPYEQRIVAFKYKGRVVLAEVRLDSQWPSNGYNYDKLSELHLRQMKIGDGEWFWVDHSIPELDALSEFVLAHLNQYVLREGKLGSWIYTPIYDKVQQRRAADQLKGIGNTALSRTSYDPALRPTALSRTRMGPEDVQEGVTESA